MTERVMTVAAHPDDETLGCGATLAKHVAAGDAVCVIVLADGVGSRGFSTEMVKQRHGMCRRACKILGTEDVWLHQYADNQMDTLALLQVVKHLETHLERFKPTVVYTHHGGDMNVDHRVTHDAVRVACRPQPGCTVKRLLHFEVPSSTEWGDGFVPNHFVEVDAALLQKKGEALEQYTTEMRAWPHPRSFTALSSLAAHRGASVGVNAAEAFMVGRVIA